jgi:hydrogenase maturation protein HypF
MKSVKITVTGIVQGVGFRPFVYRLAKQLDLKGYVRNLGGSEVEIVVEGSPKVIEEFLRRLKADKPPPADIYDMKVDDIEPKGFEDFSIEESGRKREAYSMIPPDIGICSDCLLEVLNAEDRRFMYPFNSCAWCGPRFSMMEKIPYDRENTSMRDFPMCSSCLGEYENPSVVRRFHAQGNCCPVCGPRVWLEDRNGFMNVENPILEASKLIDEGFIVAVKGLGGFHIACLATDDEVVLELRRRKCRYEKPFALMALNLEVASRIVSLSDEDARLLESPRRPILLLPGREDSPVSRYVAPGLSMQGVMLPYTALHYLILSNVRDGFLIMTSGNEGGEPMCIDNDEAKLRLNNIVDYFLMHNRRIINRVDDSVLRKTGRFYTIIRRSRGYAPTWIKLPFNISRPVIALGAHYQNTGCLAFKDVAIPTQFIGDMENVSSLMELDKALTFLIKNYGIDPSKALLAVDMHPKYLNRILADKWIKTYGCELLEVQHHHAHAASLMAELKAGSDSEEVAVTIDGAGYGNDGTVWGGEVLIVKYGSFIRFGHLEQTPMPGGDRAAEYPVRMLISILSKFMSREEVEHFIVSRGLHRGLPYGVEELEATLLLLEKGGLPVTSSMGRVLDAASSLLGICFRRTYEGEPAMKLEAFSKMQTYVELPTPKISSSKLVIETHKIFEELICKLDKPRELLAYSIQRALGLSLGEVAVAASKGRNVYRVLVSGGAAVNTVIFESIREVVENEGLKAYVNVQVPPGDGGISLGQAVIAGFSTLT